MRSTKVLRAVKAGYIAISSLLCLLGVLMLALPELSVSLVGVAIGVMLVAFGAVKLMGYFSRDLYRLAFQHDLALGILLAVLGVLVLCNPNRAASFLCLILGIGIAADGLFKLQTAFDARRFGLKSWGLILALGIVTGIIGVVAAFRPVQSAQLVTLLLGLCLLTEGVMNLTVGLSAIKIIRHQRPDVIETEFDDD